MPESNEASVDFNFQSGDFKPNQAAPSELPASDPVETPAKTPDPRPSGPTSWLDSLLGGVEGAEEDVPFDETEEDPEEDPDAVGDDGLTDEEREYVKQHGKGKLADFYRQKYAQAPETNEEDGPALSPEEERLKGIDDGIKTAKDRVAQMVKEHRRALQLGASDDELDQMESEIEEQRVEVARLTQRREGVAATVEQRQIVSLQQRYEEGFVQRMVEDHGLSKDQADKVRARIIQDPRISAMMAQANTRELLAMPLVQDVFTKAALYDMQYNTKKKTRAPSDPAPRGGRSGGGVGTGDRPARGGFPTDDRNFSDFMTGRSANNKGGKK